MVYDVGCHRIDVTPPIGTWLAGYAARTEPSDDVYHPLRAVTTVIGDGTTDVLIVSIEWLGFYDLTEDARRRITEETGIPGDRIVLCGTHTHCGPAIRSIDARRHGDASIDPAYINRTLDRLAEASLSAMESRRPARLETASDWCGFAASRRKPDGKGGVLWEPSFDAPHDHEVPVVLVRSPDGALRQVLFSYACHPTSTGAIRQIGCDYPGYACEAIEHRYPGSVACFLKGCGGDQKPDPSEGATGSFRKLSIEAVAAMGGQLGDAVCRTVEHGPCRDVDGSLNVSQSFVTLEADPVTADALEAARGSGRAAYVAWADHYDEAFHAGNALPTRVSLEIQTITIGRSLALITLAGEMTVEYGLRLKRELAHAYDRVMPLGYANGIVGYVPVERQRPEGGYEVDDNARALLYSGPFASGSEERIVDEVKTMTLGSHEHAVGD